MKTLAQLLNKPPLTEAEQLRLDVRELQREVDYLRRQLRQQQTTSEQQQQHLTAARDQVAILTEFKTCLEDAGITELPHYLQHQAE